VVSFIFDVKVVPSSGRNKWILEKSGKLKCYLKSPPKKGLANKELKKMLAKALRVKQVDIEIVFGATGRNKKIKVPLDIDFEGLLKLLGLEQQKKLF